MDNSDNAIAAAVFAMKYALCMDTQRVSTEHYLVALLVIQDCNALKILDAMDLDLPALRGPLFEQSCQSVSRIRHVSRIASTDEFKGVTQRACEVALERGSSILGTDHMLLGMMECAGSAGGRILAAHGATRARCVRAANTLRLPPEVCSPIPPTS